MTVWINGVAGGRLAPLDRGLQYGDGLFETMRVRGRTLRLLGFHLERLADGCRRLAITPPDEKRLRNELIRIASRRSEAVLKLIVTRGVGPRGYRPSGAERVTRVMVLQPLPPAARAPAPPARIRLCSTRLGMSPSLAGLKTLNRLESVLARAEWQDARVWEGLMRDTDDTVVCGTMSNLFIRRGPVLLTPLLDRCGISGVMRRWVMTQAGALRLQVIESRLRWEDVVQAEEVFMTNAVAGVVPVGSLRSGRSGVRLTEHGTALELARRLELL